MSYLPSARFLAVFDEIRARGYHDEKAAAAIAATSLQIAGYSINEEGEPITTLRTACAHNSQPETKKMTYSANGYIPALEALQTPEQIRALEIKSAAFAAIDQQAAATSTANAGFRAANQNRQKYPAPPNPYAAVLKGN